MLTDFSKAPVCSIAQKIEESDSSLADRSLELYDFLGERYLELDRCRGDDMDIIKEEVIKNPRGCCILDAGCGPGMHVAQCSQLPFVNRVQGVDFSAGMIEAARHCAVDTSKKATVKLRVHDLLKPADDIGLFDIVLCMNNVLGDVLSKDVDAARDDRKRFLQNIRSYMTISGRIVLSVYMRA